MLVQFKAIPVRLCDTPVTFERLLELVLQVLTWTIYLEYLDDTVMPRNFNKHLSNLKEVFTKLRYIHF